MTRNIFLDDPDTFARAEAARIRARRDPRPMGTERRYRSLGHTAGGTAAPRANLPAIIAPLATDEMIAAEIRAVLTEPDEVAVPGAVQRAAAISMTGVMAVAMPPIGGAMFVVNAVHQSDVRLSAQLTALGGLAVALRMAGTLPMA